MNIMDIKRCGTCHFAKVVAQDITKRLCFGAPPSAIQMPSPQGQITVRSVRPIVGVSDEACRLYLSKTEADRALDTEAFESLQQAMKTQ